MLYREYSNATAASHCLVIQCLIEILLNLFDHAFEDLILFPEKVLSLCIIVAELSEKHAV